MIVVMKIKLTPFVKEDIQPLFRWINDAETVRYNNAYKPVTWDSHITWFENLGKDTSRAIFAIRAAEDERLVGTVQLCGIHPVYRSAELSIRIGELSDRNQGFGTMAVKLAVTFGFNDLNLERIYLHVFADNEAALKVYKKIGFVEEGRLKKAAFINGKWVDVIPMALLRENYLILGRFH